MNPAARNHVEGAIRGVRERQHALRRKGDELVEIIRVPAFVGDGLKLGHERAVKWKQILVRLSYCNAWSHEVSIFFSCFQRFYENVPARNGGLEFPVEQLRNSRTDPQLIFLSD